MDPWTIISFSPPPLARQGTGVNWNLYPPGSFRCESVTVSFAWGLQPDIATLSFVVPAKPATPPVYAGGLVTFQLGGHYFVGVCKTAITEKDPGGWRYVVQAEDMRCMLTWDKIFCSFNKLDIVQVGGIRKRRWRHLTPANFPANVWTYTDAPLTGAQIIAYMLAAPTVETGWAVYYSHATTGAKTAGYHPSLAYPSFDIDCSGIDLGAGIQQVLDQHGLLLTIIATSVNNGFDLVFGRKGQGPTVAIPDGSTQRRDGSALSDVPHRVLIVGDQNRYQYNALAYYGPEDANNTLEPDWMPAWEVFWGDPMKLRDWVYENLSTPATIGTIPQGTRYNAIEEDTENISGMMLAMSRAMEITVEEVAWAKEDLGGNADDWVDYRLFAGQSRRLMPAVLYLQTLVYRAFRITSAFSFVNVFGQTVTIDGISLVPEMLEAMSHDPISGILSRGAGTGDGPGYAIVKGFRVGEDAFKALRPDKFNLDDFTNLQNVYSKVEFQIDDSGSPDGRYILFSDPVISCAGLFTKGVGVTELAEMNGFAALNDNATITVPEIRVGLTFAAERYIQPFINNNGTITPVGFAAIGMRDGCVNVPGLQEDVLILEVGPLVSRLPYSDGASVLTKATQIANAYLARQWWYRLGGYQRSCTKAGYTPNLLHGNFDRISVKLDVSGYIETTDFTSERTFQGYIGSRDFDRQKADMETYPGAKLVREEARHWKTAAVALLQDPKTAKAICDIYHGYTEEVLLDTGGCPATIPAFCPIRCAADKKRPVVYPTDTPDSDIFVGVSVKYNIPTATTKLIRVKDQGIVECRVKGPVAVKDMLGLSSEATADYLIKGGSYAMALQEIVLPDPLPEGDTGVRVIKIRLGGGAASTGMFRLRSVPIKTEANPKQGDYVIARTLSLNPDGSYSEGTENIKIAKPPKLRQSLASEIVLRVTNSYAYTDSANSPDTNNVYRDVTRGTTTERQLVLPPWVCSEDGPYDGTGEIIFATNRSTGITDDDGVAISWLYDSPHRQWGKV